MRTKSAIALAAILCLAAGPASAVPAPDPETGKIAGFTYGEDAYNSYTAWSGSMLWIWQFSAQRIGYEGTPVAGRPFYVHAHAAMISPHSVTGDVLLTLDQDAGGLPLRYTPSSAMPLTCYLTQFDPVVSVSQVACRKSVSQESGQYVISDLAHLVPGFGVEVLVPVTADSATSGTAAMTAMWATGDVGLNTPNVMASVPVTVGPPPTKPLPKALRSYPKVKSLTPGVCAVKKHKVVVLKPGLCKLKGGKKVVKVRY